MSPRYVVAAEPRDDTYWGDTWDVVDAETDESVGSFAGSEDSWLEAQAHADELNRSGRNHRGGTP